ncbi:hypothetical protein P3W45_001345 [Vairimorpha bombi]|jgi:meiotic recombination protein SPO11
MKLESIKNKLEELVIKTLKSIRRHPNILQKIKFYEQVHQSLSLNIIKNKREIYYNSVQIFRTQKNVDKLIKETCSILGVSQPDLLISTTLKGIFNGSLVFYRNNKIIYQNNQGTSLIPDMSTIDRVKCEYKKCVVIEKDTIFSKIVRSYTRNDILFVCGKGYPCGNTLSLVKNLVDVKIYGLFDFDPYGLEICSKYPSLKRIGLCLEDIEWVDKSSYIKLSEFDNRKIERMMLNHNFNKDLNFMKNNNLKIELEGLFNSKEFNLECFLDSKIEYKSK